MKENGLKLGNLPHLELWRALAGGGGRLNCVFRHWRAIPSYFSLLPRTLEQSLQNLGLAELLATELLSHPKQVPAEFWSLRLVSEKLGA